MRCRFKGETTIPLAPPNLRTDPIARLVRQLAWPASIGLLFNTFYNVIDTWFARYLGTHGLAALSISFPFFFMIIAMGYGLSTGTAALVGAALGGDRKTEAGHIGAQAIAVGALFSVLFAYLGHLALPPMLGLLTDDQSVFGMARTYLEVILLGVPIIIVQGILNAGLNARGDMVAYRNVLIVGCLLNLVLDPLFLFGLPDYGFPPLGVAGLAWSTILIRLGGLVYLGVRARRLGCFAGQTIIGWRPTVKITRQLLAQSVPNGLDMMTVSAGVFVINYFLERFAATEAVAAYGVAMRFEQIALLPTIGLTTAILTLVAQNSGAGRMDRVKKVYTTALVYGLLVMVVMAVLIIPFAPILIGLFDSNPRVVEIGTTYLHIEMITFYAYVVLFCTISLLQGLKRPIWGLVIGVARQLVLPAGLFYLLGEFLQMGVLGVFWGICVITWSAALFSATLAWRILDGV